MDMRWFPNFNLRVNGGVYEWRTKVSDGRKFLVSCGGPGSLLGGSKEESLFRVSCPTWKGNSYMENLEELSYEQVFKALHLMRGEWNSLSIVQSYIFPMDEWFGEDAGFTLEYGSIHCSGPFCRWFVRGKKYDASIVMSEGGTYSQYDDDRDYALFEIAILSKETGSCVYVGPCEYDVVGHAGYREAKAIVDSVRRGDF